MFILKYYNNNNNIMGGGLMQLVAYGAQDVYLSGNPQMTFFKVVYRRHTNFSMESIQQTINGTSTINTSSTGNGSVTISRNGDLVTKVYVVVKNAKVAYGAHIVNEVDVEIGGQRIDRHSRNWLQTWWELSTPHGMATSFRAMIGELNHIQTTRSSTIDVQTSLHIPLQFWFCRNPGLALPLIALQYHEVKLNFTWGKYWSYLSGSTGTCEVWCDYIYLDTDERRRFAQVSHEYLIEQVQKMEKTTGTTASTTGESLSVKLNFNHPVKELIWNYHGNFFTDIKLKLNGHDRFAEQPEEYFTLRQPYEYHSSVPGHNLHRPNDITTLAATTQIDSVGSVDANTKIKVEIPTTSSPGKITFNSGSPDLDLISVGDVIEITNSSTPTKGGTIKVTGKIPSEITQLLPTLQGFIHFSVISSTATAGSTTMTVPANSETLAVKILKGYISALPYENHTSHFGNKIGVYSFALKPEEHQPSGTCNFSRIDTAIFEGNYCVFNSGTADVLTIYAVNYNVLRIMSGMGGLAYAN